MPYCPCCHQPVKTEAIACSDCGTLLKAHGHPGIPLHYALGAAFLCESCRYDADDTCTFPQRPFARECTLYRDQSVVTVPRQTKARPGFGTWLQRNDFRLLLLLISLTAIAVLLASLTNLSRESINSSDQPNQLR